MVHSAISTHPEVKTQVQSTWAILLSSSRSLTDVPIVTRRDNQANNHSFNSVGKIGGEWNGAIQWTFAP